MITIENFKTIIDNQNELYRFDEGFEILEVSAKISLVKLKEARKITVCESISQLIFSEKNYEKGDYFILLQNNTNTTAYYFHITAQTAKYLVETAKISMYQFKNKVMYLIY